MILNQKIYYIGNILKLFNYLKNFIKLFSNSNEDGVLKLTDFGFAKRALDDGEKVLATPLYTPYYSSPEV